MAIVFYFKYKNLNINPSDPGGEQICFPPLGFFRCYFLGGLLGILENYYFGVIQTSTNFEKIGFQPYFTKSQW